jgi:hypothetical protein
MIWLTWRQFRAPALACGVLLAVALAYLVYLGTDIRDAHDAYRARCDAGGDCAAAMRQFHSDYSNLLLYLAGVFGLVPVLIGVFWGAPLVARELETGTHRLVWNQSVSRRKWLTVKVLVVAGAAMAVAAGLSVTLTWAAGPVDRIGADRFELVVFGARNLAPVGYAAFAVVFGTVVGMVLRRTLAAMAVTLLAVVVIQFAVPNLIRPHYLPGRDLRMPMTAEAINAARGLGSITGAAVVKGVTVDDAWVTDASVLRTADGRPLSRAGFDRCFTQAPDTGASGTFGDTAACLGALDLHIDVEYQPADRYWVFQWLELTLYLAAGALLLLGGWWVIRRRIG